jgi:hypothetical protein
MYPEVLKNPEQIFVTLYPFIERGILIVEDSP